MLDLCLTQCDWFTGSPSAGNWENLELADEIMDVNETRLEDMTRTEVLSHIHEVRILQNRDQG